jgi:hypothetical protein
MIGRLRGRKGKDHGKGTEQLFDADAAVANPAFDSIETTAATAHPGLPGEPDFSAAPAPLPQGRSTADRLGNLQAPTTADEDAA